MQYFYLQKIEAAALQLRTHFCLAEVTIWPSNFGQYQYFTFELLKVTFSASNFQNGSNKPPIRIKTRTKPGSEYRIGTYFILF